MKLSPYVGSWEKRWFDIGLIVVFLPIEIVMLFLVALVVFIFDGWPIIISQRRVGIGGRVFKLYKFRTMRRGAETEQDKWRYMNEADGPVFKIRNDPRFVGIGRWLAHMGLDELPQLINVIRGEMSLVGPRPLPIHEHKQIAEKYKQLRERVKPGMVSEWVVRGAHAIPFKEWMEMDVKYVQYGNLNQDVMVMIRVVSMLIQQLRG